MQHGDAEVLAKGSLNGYFQLQSLFSFGDTEHLSLFKGVKGFSRRGLSFELKPCICGAEGKQGTASNGTKSESSRGQALHSVSSLHAFPLQLVGTLLSISPSLFKRRELTPCSN